MRIRRACEACNPSPRNLQSALCDRPPPANGSEGQAPSKRTSLKYLVAQAAKVSYSPRPPLFSLFPLFFSRGLEEAGQRGLRDQGTQGWPQGRLNGILVLASTFS